MLSTSKFLPSKWVGEPLIGITPIIFNMSIISFERDMAGPSKFSIIFTIFVALSSLHLGLCRDSGKHWHVEYNGYGSHSLL